MPDSIPNVTPDIVVPDSLGFVTPDIVVADSIVDVIGN